MHIITKLLASALFLLIIERILPGVSVENVYYAILAALVLGLLNAVVRPVLIILTLPISVITLGLFTFVINAGIFMFAASFLEGFAVDGFWNALLGSVLLSIASTLVDRALRPARR
jgi:putative membrane protein